MMNVSPVSRHRTVRCAVRRNPLPSLASGAKLLTSGNTSRADFFSALPSTTGITNAPFRYSPEAKRSRAVHAKRQPVGAHLKRRSET
jgi:hypothetical protein